MRWFIGLLAFCALGLGAQSPQALSNDGVKLYLQERDREAVALFRQALKLDPGLVAPNLFCGLALTRLKRPAEALPYLERAYKLDSTGVLPALALAQARLALGRFQLAHDAYRAAARRDPRSSEAWFGVGITGKRLLDAAAARHDRPQVERLKTVTLDALERAVSLDPHSERAQLLMAESLRDSGDYTGALRGYNALIQSGRALLPARLGLAITHWKAGDVDSAMEPLSLLLKSAPDDAEANGIMADLLARRGDYTGAKEHAARALRGNPRQPYVWLALAKVHLAEERPADAVAALQHSLPSDTDGSQYYLLRRALLKLGRTEEARQALAEFERRRTRTAGAPAQP